MIDKPGEVRVGEVPDPTPGHGEIVVRVGACGVCGTDLHIADGEFPPSPYPIVPGHEFAGEIVALGGGVRRECCRTADPVAAGRSGARIGDKITLRTTSDDPHLFHPEAGKRI